MDTLIFKDSLNYFARALSGLPAMFGLREEKGHFPHLINTPDRIHDIYPELPDLSFYEPDRRSAADRSALIRWWEENRQTVFNVAEELVHYCAQDVTVLRQACTIYRNVFVQTTHIDPFERPCTQARLSLEVFMRRHMPARTIVNMPELGMRVHDRQSILARRYFRLMERLDPTIQVRDSTWSVGEARFDKLRVDGEVRTLEKNFSSLISIFRFWTRAVARFVRLSNFLVAIGTVVRGVGRIRTLNWRVWRPPNNLTLRRRHVWPCCAPSMMWLRLVCRNFSN